MASPPSLVRPPRAARRLLSIVDGSPMLALPLERFSVSGSASAAQESGFYRRQHRHGRRRLRERWRQLDDSSSGGRRHVPLWASDGTHFVHAYVGNPPHRVTLIVDTGSDTMAFPCMGCTKCRSGRDQTFWDPKTSRTAAVLGCDDCQEPYRCNSFGQEPVCSFRQRYSEGSMWSAIQVSDVVRLGGRELETDGDEMLSYQGNSSVTFGCISAQSGMFDTQIPDGIIGMGPGEHGVVWNMAETQTKESKSFSLCFSERGGTMVVGGYDPALLEAGEEHVFTNTTVESGWYVVQVEDVALGSTSIADTAVLQAMNNGGGTIVDSGTTDTYLPTPIQAAFSQAWAAITGQPYQQCVNSDLCLQFTREQFAKLPDFSITLTGGVALSLRPAQYMEQGVRGGETFYGPRIYLTESHGAVIGANMMMDYSVLYDMGKKQIGFAKARCDSGNTHPNETDDESPTAVVKGDAATGRGEVNNKETTSSDDDDSGAMKGIGDDTDDGKGIATGQARVDVDRREEDNIGTIASDTDDSALDGRAPSNGEGRSDNNYGGSNRNSGSSSDSISSSSSSSSSDSASTSRRDRLTPSSDDNDGTRRPDGGTKGLVGHARASITARAGETDEVSKAVAEGQDQKIFIGVDALVAVVEDDDAESIENAIVASSDSDDDRTHGVVDVEVEGNPGDNGDPSDVKSELTGDDVAGDGAKARVKSGVKEGDSETDGYSRRERVRGERNGGHGSFSVVGAGTDDGSADGEKAKGAANEERQGGQVHDGEEGHQQKDGELHGDVGSSQKDPSTNVSAQTDVHEVLLVGDVPDGGDASALAPGAPNVSSPLANLGDVDCQVDVVEKYSCEVECPTSVDHPVSVKGLQKTRREIVIQARGKGRACPSDADLVVGAELPCTVLCPSANGPAASAPDVHPADVDAPKVSSGTTDANADTDNTGKADSPHDGGILHAGHNPGKGNSGENAKHWDGGNGVSGMDGRIGAGEDGFGSDAHRESGENAGGKGGMYRDRDQETARTDVNETDEGGRNSAAGKQQERVEGERTHESNGKTAEASGGAKVKNESMMGRDRGTGDRGAKGNDETACLHSPVWGPCDATCEQEMSAGEQCRGRRRKQVRSCHIGDLCPSASRGIYADLAFSIDLGSNTAAADAAAAGRTFLGNEDEIWWRWYVGDALTEALAGRLKNECDVLAGDIDLVVLAPPGKVVATMNDARRGQKERAQVHGRKVGSIRAGQDDDAGYSTGKQRKSEDYSSLTLSADEQIQEGSSADDTSWDGNTEDDEEEETSKADAYETNSTSTATTSDELDSASSTSSEMSDSAEDTFTNARAARYHDCGKRKAADKSKQNTLVAAHASIHVSYEADDSKTSLLSRADGRKEERTELSLSLQQQRQQLDACIVALASAGLASDLTSSAAKELHKRASTKEGKLLAERVRVVEVGRVTVRSAGAGRVFHQIPGMPLPEHSSSSTTGGDQEIISNTEQASLASGLYGSARAKLAESEDDDGNGPHGSNQLRFAEQNPDVFGINNAAVVRNKSQKQYMSHSPDVLSGPARRGSGGGGDGGNVKLYIKSDGAGAMRAAAAAQSQSSTPSALFAFQGLGIAMLLLLLLVARGWRGASSRHGSGSGGNGGGGSSRTIRGSRGVTPASGSRPGNTRGRSPPVRGKSSEGGKSNDVAGKDEEHGGISAETRWGEGKKA